MRIISGIIVLDFIILFVFSSCGNNSDKEVSNNSNSAINKINHLEWLIGKWENSNEYGYFIETWQKMNDSALFATSFIIKDNDTIFAEEVKLEYKSESIYYIVNTLNQNQGKAVPFKLISWNDGIFIFENKDHDFPQQIIYHQIGQDSILAKIEGTENGKLRVEEFPMVRKR